MSTIFTPISASTSTRLGTCASSRPTLTIRGRSPTRAPDREGGLEAIRFQPALNSVLRVALREDPELLRVRVITVSSRLVAVSGEKSVQIIACQPVALRNRDIRIVAGK